MIVILLFETLHAQDKAPDTVRTGIYITSIHDIDFKQNEYSVNLWLWMKYKNKEFDFEQNLEIPQAKSFTKSYATKDTLNGEVYLLMKLQCLMKDSWRIDNFPFDHQRLRMSIENSQFDSSALVFLADTLGGHYDKYAMSRKGWRIDSFIMSTGMKSYETSFGESSLGKPYSVYGTFKVKIVIAREPWWLFLKMFLGMFIAFLIAYTSFHIHPDHIDSRFALSVGAIFAAIGNKYIVDSSLPESTSFTLVDTLHGVTLFFIFLVVASSAYSLQLVKKERHQVSRKFDRFMSKAILVLYIVINVYFVSVAYADISRPAEANISQSSMK